MKVMWGKDKLYFIKEVQPEKIQQALDFVEKVLNGKIGFCFKAVPKIPRHEGFEIQNKIERRKKAIMETESNEIASCIREEVKKLKKQVKDYISFDKTAESQLKRNHGKLLRSLCLLSNEGIIGSYTLLATGKLRVAWIDEVQLPKIITIEQGFTYTYSHEPMIKTKVQIDKEYQNDRLFCPVLSDFNKPLDQGKVRKDHEGNQATGPVGIDPVVLRYKRGQKVQIPELKEVSDLLEGLEPIDIVRTAAYLMYLKERYKR
jgi:hypothetical protein